MDEGDCSKGTSRGKRVWSRQEDGLLVEGLTELTLQGRWRADNGTFKPGYLQWLEKWMMEKNPGCGLKAQPHIESRVKLLKKQYNAIAEMLGPNYSGFGWNDSKKCIEVDKLVFDEWVKSHPNAKGLRNKPFPDFEELQYVFSKDRANGLDAENPRDMAESVNLDKEADQFTQFDCYVPQPPENLDHDGFATNFSEPRLTTPSFTANTIRSGKKRAKSDDPLLETMTTTVKDFTTFFSGATESIKELVSCFQHEVENEKNRKLLNNELRKIQTLNIGERVQLDKILARDQLLTDYFFTLEESEKVEFVMSLLRNDIDK